MSRQSARWAAACMGCEAITIIDGDGRSLPDPSEWDSFSSCLVCGDTLSLDEFGDSQWERESWLMRSAAARMWDQCHEALASLAWPLEGLDRATALDVLVNIKPRERAETDVVA